MLIQAIKFMCSCGEEVDDVSFLFDEETLCVSLNPCKICLQNHWELSERTNKSLVTHSRERIVQLESKLDAFKNSLVEIWAAIDKDGHVKSVGDSLDAAIQNAFAAFGLLEEKDPHAKLFELNVQCKKIQYWIVP